MTTRPLQNRVDPWGSLRAVPERGGLMGNRGILHDAQQRIVKPWAHQAWITCLLSFGNYRRTPFSPRNYSELFFLDEATAFAAGHRPCGECQRERYWQFKDYWSRAQGQVAPKVKEIDAVLHAERALRGGGKRTYLATLADLPIGAMFDDGQGAWLVWRDGCRAWSFAGYGPPTSFDRATVVRVLTPPAIVRVFALGFVPRVHPSVDAERGAIQGSGTADNPHRIRA